MLSNLAAVSSDDLMAEPDPRKGVNNIGDEKVRYVAAFQLQPLNIPALSLMKHCLYTLGCPFHTWKTPYIEHVKFLFNTA